MVSAIHPFSVIAIILTLSIILLIIGAAIKAGRVKKCYSCRYFDKKPHPVYLYCEMQKAEMENANVCPRYEYGGNVWQGVK